MKHVPTLRRKRAHLLRRSPTVSTGPRASSAAKARRASYAFRSGRRGFEIPGPRSPLDLIRARLVRLRPRRAVSLDQSWSSAGAGAARASSSPSSVWAAAPPRGPRPLSERPRPPPLGRPHPSTQPRPAGTSPARRPPVSPASTAEASGSRARMRRRGTTSEPAGRPAAAVAAGAAPSRDREASAATFLPSLRGLSHLLVVLQVIHEVGYDALEQLLRAVRALRLLLTSLTLRPPDPDPAPGPAA